MKYEIGQEVWQATFEVATAYVECPDCAGTGRVRVMLPDDTIVSVECEGCRRGYKQADGKIRVHNREPRAKRATISGVEVEGGKIEWKTTESYRVPEEQLFDNEADAFAAAQERAAKFDREERERVNQKEKPLESWAWHAHYHRSCIRRAKEEIERHTARLAVANVKAKEKKGETTP